MLKKKILGEYFWCHPGNPLLYPATLGTLLDVLATFHWAIATPMDWWSGLLKHFFYCLCIHAPDHQMQFAYCVPIKECRTGIQVHNFQNTKFKFHISSLWFPVQWKKRSVVAYTQIRHLIWQVDGTPDFQAGNAVAPHMRYLEFCDAPWDPLKLKQKQHWVSPHTRGDRGLGGHGVSDVTWQGADCTILFIDLSYVLGPIFRPLWLSSVMGQM